MAGWSNAEEQAILGWYFNSDVKTPDAVLYLALLTSAGDDDSNVIPETTYPSYARVSIASSGGNWVYDGASKDPTFYHNANLIQFPKCTGASADTLTHWALMDAVSAGNLRFHGSLAVPLVMGDQVQPQFDANALQVRLGG